MATVSRTLVEQRVRSAIDMPLELPEVEFKQSATFESIQHRIAKTSIAMANLRDGGTIIVGVAQDANRRFVVQGVARDIADTYVQEMVSDFVAKYASPPVEIRVLPIEHHDALFVAIAVSPFERMPVVCKRNTPDGTTKNDRMHEGDFLVRIADDTVSTMRVKNAAMMHDLLERATGRRAAELIRTLSEGGVRLESLSAPSRYDREVQDLGELL